MSNAGLPGWNEAADAGTESKSENVASGWLVQAEVTEGLSRAARGSTTAPPSAFKIFATSWARPEESLENVLPIPWRHLWFRV